MTQSHTSAEDPVLGTGAQPGGPRAELAPVSHRGAGGFGTQCGDTGCPYYCDTQTRRGSGRLSKVRSPCVGVEAPRQWWHGALAREASSQKHLSEGQSKLPGTSGFEKQLLVMFAGESCWDFSFFFQYRSSYRAKGL